MGKRGAAAAALVDQRRGAMLIVGVQPRHHGLRVTACAGGHLRGTGALGHLVQRQETLAAARMSGVQGKLAQIDRGLIPPLIVNA